MAESFEEVLEKYGTLTYTNKGISMLPMLRPEKDVFTLVKKGDRRCKENDVVLFKRNGRYILHRVVKVKEDSYTMMGDNCCSFEDGVKDEDILGVLTSFQRGGKKISVEDEGYLAYVKRLRAMERYRIFFKKKAAALKHQVKKLLGRK